GAVQKDLTATKQFTITNTGGGILTINSVVATGTYYSITEYPASYVLEMNETTTFTVQYAPTAVTEGETQHEGLLTITHSEAGRTAVEIDLFGTCFDPTITSFPFFEGFEAGNTDQSTTISQWTQEVGPLNTAYSWTANNSLTSYNRTPKTGDWNAYLHYSGQSYLFRPIVLEGGTDYYLEFYARQDGATAANSWVKADFGTAASIAGMTTSIVAQTGIVWRLSEVLR
ncbi:MAG TPA: hypothetical protein PKI59_05070, partial [Candidatus Cloacimonadota bacterium]|nr:hypothetical protein [Candidatus Cloacimonadota bacterium]